MRLSHRLLATALALLCAAQVAPASAQTAFPNQPLKFVIAFGPGGVADSTARIVAEKLGDKLGQRVVVENNPGGGGIAAARAVIAAPADGHTLALLTNGTSISVSLFKSLPFDPVKDFTPVSKLGAFEFFVIAKADGPHTTLGDFLKAAKANPGKLNFASPGVGTSVHLAGELFKRMAGIEMVHVAYRGSSQALVDLVGGSVDLMLDNIPSSIGLAREGKIRPLGVTTARRSSIAPDIPAIAETVPGYDMTVYFGIAVNSATPQAIRDVIERDVRALAQERSVRERFRGLAAETVGSSAAEFGALVARERERWGKLITDLKIKIE